MVGDGPVHTCPALRALTPGAPSHPSAGPVCLPSHKWEAPTQTGCSILSPIGFTGLPGETAGRGRMLSPTSCSSVSVTRRPQEDRGASPLNTWSDSFLLTQGEPEDREGTGLA